MAGCKCSRGGEPSLLKGRIPGVSIRYRRVKWNRTKIAISDVSDVPAVPPWQKQIRRNIPPYLSQSREDDNDVRDVGNTTLARFHITLRYLMVTHFMSRQATSVKCTGTRDVQRPNHMITGTLIKLAWHPILFVSGHCAMWSSLSPWYKNQLFFSSFLLTASVRNSAFS